MYMSVCLHMAVFSFVLKINKNINDRMRKERRKKGKKRKYHHQNAKGEGFKTGT